MEEQIVTHLDGMEQGTILFAVESGSRAWGMESDDSDYDIRYIYHYTVSEYLSLFNDRTETNSEFITDDSAELDFTGWDIYKFLRLVSKSNPTALEWIRSPIVYIDHWLRSRLLEITQDFSRFSLFMHYQSLAKSNWQKYIEDRTDATTKRYLYVLRGILSAIYIFETLQFPPLNLSELVHKLQSYDKWQISYLSEELADIIRMKKAGNETDRHQVSSSLKYWISDTFEMLREIKDEMESKDNWSIDKQSLEKLLVEILEL